MKRLNDTYKEVESRITVNNRKGEDKMTHIMKLKELCFNNIKYGTKEYEIRLNDEKRRKTKKKWRCCYKNKKN